MSLLFVDFYARNRPIGETSSQNTYNGAPNLRGSPRSERAPIAHSSAFGSGVSRNSVIRLRCLRSTSKRNP